MDREQRFLLRLIGRQPASGDDVLDLETAVTALDWPRVLELAAPTLHPYLDHCVRARLPEERVPVEVRERLRLATRANALLQLRQFEEFRNVIEALSSAQVPALTLKGAALACEVYPERVARPMADLDLLVHEADLGRAREALLGIGLRVPARFEVRPTSGSYAMREVDKPFERPGTAFLVELKTELESTLPPFRFTTDSAWARSVPATLAGGATRVLHPEDFLVHLCLHACGGHRFDQGLRPLVDIRLFIEHHARQWDWPRLAASCLAQANAGWMYLTLALARDLLAAPVPDAFFAALPVPPNLAEASALATEQIWEGHRVRIPLSVAAGFALEDRRQRVRWFAERLNPWRRDELGDRPTPAGLARGVLAGLRRGALYATSLGRKLQTARRENDLSLAMIRRAIRLQRGRKRLEHLMSRRDS